MKTCTRCLMDETVPGIRFDQQGVCHLCHVQDRLYRTYYAQQDVEKEKAFADLIETIKAEGKGRPYDCILPISGGGDSSYAVYLTKKMGLRALAYHFDNGWVSDVARHNIAAVTGPLGVPVRTVQYAPETIRDAYVACLKASMPEVCLPCLIAIWSLAYSAAEKEGIRYVIHSSSPMTEGITPLRWSYGDGRYLESVVKQFGTPGALETVRDYNRLRITDLFSSTFVRKTKIIMLPLYVEWDDEANKELLKREFDWRDGGKHSDCIYTPFRNYVIWKKFNIDLRKLAPSAQIRSGRVARENAVDFFDHNPPTLDPERLEFVLNRLGLTHAQFEEILAAPPKTFMDYSTYYPILRQMRPIIRWLSKTGMISEFAYDKYFEC